MKYSAIAFMCAGLLGAGLLGSAVFAQMQENGSMMESEAGMMKEEGTAAQEEHQKMHKGSMSEANITAKAVAYIKATEPTSDLSGVVSLVETDGELMIKAELFNVPDPGLHGFHVHENGSCDDGGNAAGGHFNPQAAEHGLLSENGFQEAHAGDLGNIEIAEDGSADAFYSVPLSLTEGEYNVMGKAIILHEKEDDFGQPTGNAGGRIGCGIIEPFE